MQRVHSHNSSSVSTYTQWCYELNANVSKMYIVYHVSLSWCKNSPITIKYRGLQMFLPADAGSGIGNMGSILVGHRVGQISLLQWDDYTFWARVHPPHYTSLPLPLSVVWWIDQLTNNSIHSDSTACYCSVYGHSYCSSSTSIFVPSVASVFSKKISQSHWATTDNICLQ